MTAHAYVGLSGWSYQHWRHGVVYPEGLPANQWLSFIAQRFDTVELNNPFYRIPQKAAVERWASTVPQGFRFAVKLWRGFTHWNRLVDPNDRLPSVMAVFEPFRKDQRGPLLVQLPPQMEADAQRLDRFLARLEPFGWEVCVEFRNASWLTPGIRRVLDEHDAALCVHDMMWAAPVAEPNDGARVVYVRRHGPDSRYGGSYSDERLAADARAIEGWLAGGRDVYVYYNNDGQGNAVRDARRLQQALGIATLEPPAPATLRSARPRKPRKAAARPPAPRPFGPRKRTRPMEPAAPTQQPKGDAPVRRT